MGAEREEEEDKGAVMDGWVSVKIGYLLQGGLQIEFFAHKSASISATQPARNVRNFDPTPK